MPDDSLSSRETGASQPPAPAGPTRPGARVPTVVARLDRAGRCCYVSPAVERLLGRPAAAFAGRTPGEAGLPEAVGRVWEAAVADVFATASEREITFALETGDAVRDFVARIEPEAGADGRFETVLAVIRDVTADRQTEAALAESHHFLARVTEAVPGIITVFDLKAFRVVYANRAVGELLGYSVEEVVHLGDAFHARVTHPDDLPGLAARANEVAALADGAVSETEFRMQHRDGSWRWFAVHDTVFARDPDGSVRLVLGVLLDANARKQAELALRDAAERLSLALHAARMGDWSWDPATDLVTLSDRAAEIFGIPPGPFMTWADMRGLLHPDDREDAREAVERSLAERGDYDVEYRVRRPDGGWRWVLARGRGLYADGRVTGMLGVVQDVTARKDAEEALRAGEQELRRVNASLEARVEERTRELARAVHSLENVNRELQEFAYAASHDLQEPLRKVMTFTELLRSEMGAGLDPQQAYYLDRIGNASGRMSQLIRDLLAFSRVQTQGQVFQPVDLDHVAREVLADLEVAIRDAGAGVEVGPLGIVVADPVQMRQLLQNLVGNALKFHRPGAPPSVRVRAHRPPAAPGEPQPYVIEVEDDGIGFDEKFVDRIFLPFQRLHGKHQYSGTGIGLAICRRIAERHGGSITARSRPGQGATFVVTIPLRAFPGEGAR